MTKEEFIIKLFEKSGVDTFYYLDRDEILEEFDIDGDIFDKYANYWVGKGFLHGPDLTTTGSHLTLYFESSGIDYVEKLTSLHKPLESIIMNKQEIKIFVSHRSSDIELATALVKLFISALDIKKEQIRCTSVPGFRFDPGIDTIEEIRKEVNETGVLVGLLTPHSLESSYVLFELGARWGLQKPLIPLLSNGAEYDSLPTPIRNTNAVKLEKTEDIYDLLEFISKEIKISTQKVSSYQDELNNVIDKAVKKKLSKRLSDDINTDNSVFTDIRSKIKEDAEKIEKNGQRKSLLDSEKGVALAIKSGEDFYSKLETACQENSHPKAGIIFSIKRKHSSQYVWEAELYTDGASSFLKFKIPFQNSALGFDHHEDTLLKIVSANYDLFDSYLDKSESEKRRYERQYFFNVDDFLEPCWSEEKRADKGISTQALVNNIILEFYEFSKKVKS